MDINERENLIRLADVPALEWLPIRNGKPINLGTVYRWVTRGVRGRRLQVARVGGMMTTTLSWLDDFFNGPTASGGSTYPTSTQRQRAIARAEAELAADGI